MDYREVFVREYSDIVRLDRLTWIRRGYIDRSSLYRRVPMPDLFSVSGELIPLPKPRVDSASRVSVAEALLSRRSVRCFEDTPIPLDKLSTLLYLAFGVSKVEPGVYGYSRFPLRTFPSAGALQPQEVYVAVFRVEGIDPGVYRYVFHRHSLEVRARGDFGSSLVSAALGQDHVGEGNIAVAITVRWIRSSWKYGRRGYKYSLLDAGFAGENLYLASQALGLGTCAVGAFYEEDLCRILRVDCSTEIPVLLMPVGVPRSGCDY